MPKATASKTTRAQASLPKKLSSNSVLAGRVDSAVAVGTRYWLLKSEPDVFSIDDLVKAKRQTTHWDGVRNYQARNTLRDDMKIGDQVLFYHSNANPPGIAGIAEVVREGYPDFTAWDETDDHFDPKSDPQKPTWMMVDIKFVKKFEKELSLPELREMPALADMVLLRKGSRLSVQPVTAAEFEAILNAAEAD
jgi:predicted RNA-binding protein with PUA-like domain